MMNNEDKLKSMEENSKKVGKPEAVNNIYETIINFNEGESCLC